MQRDVTLLFLRKSDQILLAMKKRGFGVGKWNGVGGKLEPGETPEQAAIRECEEEINVHPKHIQKLGELDFFMPNDPAFHHHAHIFVTYEWEGEPEETEEMKPRWFATSDIPYDTMWADDRLWVPLFLDNKHFKGTIHVDEQTNEVTQVTLEEVTSVIR